MSTMHGKNDLKCDKHGVDLECMPGCSAHRSNWYCPVCVKYEDLTIPPTEAETAALLNDINMLPEGKRILRKLLYQRDRLLKNKQRGE